MILGAGTILGPYEILSPLGAGGMGEVYRARDTRLGRSVAVKILPPEFSADPIRQSRFEQEARAVAALNHPNILALYDVGRVTLSDDGAPVSYFVTELIEGRSLRQLLRDERLSLPRIVEIATAIAEGLAAAHARSVIHRDVKPENVVVTNEGTVKLIDFGLAKGTPDQVDAAQAPTQVLTTAGAMVMGTPGYMAPEQARGQAADSRSDVFSFGAVLYEMLSDKPAFTGATAVDLLSATLRDTPAPTSTPERPLPPALARIVERCLEKEPAARFQSTRDLAFALKTLSHPDAPPLVTSMGAASPPSASTVTQPMSQPAPPTSRPASATRALGWGLGGALVALAAALVIWRPWVPAPQPETTTPPQAVPSAAPAAGSPSLAAPVPTPAPTPPPSPATPDHPAKMPSPPSAPSTTAAVPRPVQSRTIALGDAPLFVGTTAASGAPFALSGDGTRLVYVGIESGGRPPGLYLSATDPFHATRLPGTDGASDPAFSADGKSVVFFAAKTLKRVGLDSGAVTNIAPIATRLTGGISWSADNTVVFGDPLFRVPAANGTPEDLHQAGQAPQEIPGGAILFTEIVPGQLPRASVRLPDGTVKELVRDAMNPRYVAPGYLVYAERTTLFAMRFDTQKLEISGSPVQVLEGVQGSAQGWSSFNVSTMGALAYVPGAMWAPPPGRQIVWIDVSDGRETPWPLPAKPYGDIVVSPNDSMVLALFGEDQPGPGGRRGPARQGMSPPRLGRANTAGGNEDLRRLWIGDTNQRTLTPVTDVAPTAFAWWPDSRRVIYAKADGSLYWRQADTATPEEQLRPAGSVSILAGQIDVAPDGRTVVWAGRNPSDTTGRAALWTLSNLDPAAPGGGPNVQIQRLFDPPAGTVAMPRVSPNGRWIAFMLVRQGRPVLTLRPLLGPGTNIEVSLDTNGAAPEWHGHQLFWRRSTAAGIEVVAADVQAGPRPAIGQPQVIFTTPLSSVTLETAHQLSADGKRLSATRPDLTIGPGEITLVLNWIEELKQRVR